MKKCRKIRTRSIGKILPLCKLPQPFLLKRKLASKHLLSIGHLWLIKLPKTWKHSLLHSCRFQWALRPHLASPFPEPVYALSCPGSWWTYRRKEILLSDTDLEAFPSSAARCKRGLLPCLRGHTGSVCSLSIAQSWRPAKSRHRCGNAMPPAIVWSLGHTPPVLMNGFGDNLWVSFFSSFFLNKCSLLSTESSNTACILFTVVYIKDSVFPLLKSFKKQDTFLFFWEFGSAYK